MVNLSIEGTYKYNFKIFQWNLVDFCNYKCHYCNYKNGKYYDKEAIQKIVKFNEMFNTSKLDYIIEFFGGEPTLHPQFVSLCKECDRDFIVFSNISKFEKIKSISNLKKFKYLYTSYHFHKPLSFDKLKYILDKDKQVLINVMIENTISESNIIDIFLYLRELIGSGGRVKLRLIDFYDNNLNKQYYSSVNLNQFRPYLDDYIIINTQNTIKNLLETDIILNSMDFKTKMVLCDLPKYFTCYSKGKFYTCSSKDFRGYSDSNINTIEFLEKSNICSNRHCNRCDFKYGTKKGIYYDNLFIKNIML